MGTRIYQCECCGMTRPLNYPYSQQPGMPAPTLRAVCVNCKAQGCTEEKTWRVLTFTHSLRCKICRTEFEAKAETPNLKDAGIRCPEGCDALELECSACGYKGVLRVRAGEAKWLPFCPECGASCPKPPEGHPDRPAVDTLSARLRFYRWMVQQGRLTDGTA